MLFTRYKAKGLEFKNVILYKFTSHEAYNKIWNVACPSKDQGEVNGTIKKIRDSYSEKDVKTSRPKDKEDKSFEEHKFYMNALYVGITRAIDNVYIIDGEKKCNLLKVIKPEKEGNVSIENVKKEESSPEEWRDMALRLIGEENIEQAKDIAVKKLLNKKEYVQEIIDALEARGYHREAQEINDKLQLQFSLGKEDKLEQVMESFSELKIDTGNPSSQSPQRCSVSPRVPTNKAKAKDNKEISNKKNRRRGGGEVVSASKERFEQEEELSKLKVSEGLKKIISRDQLDKFIEKTKQKPYNKEEMLNCVLGGNKFKIAKYLIEKKGANVNTGGNQGFFPLHVAAQNGRKDIVQLLLEHGANVNAKTKEGYTPLHSAAQYDRKDVAKLLLKEEAKVDAKDNEDYTSLHIAAQYGHKDTVELLLKEGAEVDAKNNEGCTPLYLATQHGRKDTVELLLKEGANVNAKTKEGYTPLHSAAQSGHRGIFQLLILQDGAEINAKGKEDETPLHLAVQKGHKDIVQLLLQKGANVNAKSNEGWNPLHVAAQNGRKDIVQLLLQRGADVNAKNNGYTPLSLALKNGHSEVVDLLLADPNINVGCVEIELLENGENGEKISHKSRQDCKLFDKVKEAAEKVKGEGELGELLKEIKDLLKPESKYGFKPSLNYSPDGKDENTTIKIAIEAGGKVLQLLYDYAKENIGVGTKIFEQLERAKAQQENSQLKSDLNDVSVSNHLTQFKACN